MNPQHRNYLEGLGIDGKLQERAEYVIACMLRAFLAEGDDYEVFVSEYADAERKRVYESLWLVNKTNFMEAKNFLNSIDIDFAHIANTWHYFTMTAKEFDFDKATEGSQLKVDGASSTGVSFTFKASGRNCDSLLSLVKKHILTNLYTPALPRAATSSV